MADEFMEFSETAAEDIPLETGEPDGLDAMETMDVLDDAPSDLSDEISESGWESDEEASLDDIMTDAAQEWEEPLSELEGDSGPVRVRDQTEQWILGNNAIDNTVEAMRDDLRDKGLEDGPEMEAIVMRERAMMQEELSRNIQGDFSQPYEQSDFSQLVSELNGDMPPAEPVEEDLEPEGSVEDLMQAAASEPLNDLAEESGWNELSPEMDDAQSVEELESIMTDAAAEGWEEPVLDDSPADAAAELPEIPAEAEAAQLEEAMEAAEPVPDVPAPMDTAPEGADWEEPLAETAEESAEISVEDLMTDAAAEEWEEPVLDDVPTDAAAELPEVPVEAEAAQLEEIMEDTDGVVPDVPELEPAVLAGQADVAEMMTEELEPVDGAADLPQEIDYDAVYEGLEEYDFDGVDFASDAQRLDASLEQFREETWENLSLQEQKDAMEGLAGYVMDVLDLDNPPEIVYYNNPDAGDYGGYSSATNTLSINEYTLYDNREAADTVAHELWHAYQHQRAMHPQGPKDYQYQYGFDHYIRPEEDFEGYQDQLVEAEARAFARQFQDRLSAGRRDG